MRTLALLLTWNTALLPLAAVADTKVQPHFPPGFDCSAVPAGSQRQACNRSHLDPPMGAIPDSTPVPPRQPDFIQQPKVPDVPAGPPPTIPRLPGTIQPSN